MIPASQLRSSGGVRSHLSDEARLAAAARAYLSALHSGAAPQRSEFLGRHSDLAPQLAECLEALEVVYRATAAGGIDPLMPGLGGESTILGDFRIERELGRGGMGVVYEANQLSLGRRVALKILPFAAALDPLRLQRFKLEAQAAAHLQHPSIVPVYAVGVERGVHYYAMQLIVGHSLAAVIEELRVGREVAPGARESGRSAVSLRASEAPGTPGYYRTMVRLTAQAALGLEHAHRHGVVHRDIKPANLILDDAGAVWITDFGLAHLQQSQPLTHTGETPGTLRYMSPEQLGGECAVLDCRSDVYALGATFYELLTLAPAIRDGSRPRMIEQILEGEPVAPRKLEPRIPVDLETIALKALAKGPDQRYASAQEFADDLERWLADQPIAARRPSWSERLARWERRHRTLVRSALVLMVITTVALLSATWAVVQAYHRELAARLSAEGHYRQAREIIDEFTELSEEEFAARPSLQQLRRRFLETSLTYYQSLLEARRRDAGSGEELAAASQRVAAIVEELAVLDRCSPLLLAMDPRVQQELAMTPSQCAATEGLLRQALDYRPQENFDLARWQQTLVTLLRQRESRVTRELSPAQVKRLREIAWQQQGPFAFKSCALIRLLSLTAEQRRQINAIIVTNAPRGKHGPPGPPRGREHDWAWRDPPPPREHGPHSPESRRSSARALEQILPVLTAEQRESWSNLTGVPFPYALPAKPDGWVLR